MNRRRVRRIQSSRQTLEGAGVLLRRALGDGDPAELDPFLLLDDFRSDAPRDYAPGFPWHPHRGMETITYVLRGEVEHGDSLGHRDVIGPGDVQWMTAGSGILHREMPRGDAMGAMYGFQLWANLPAAHKMSEPRYRSVRAAEIPWVAAPGGARIKIIAGEVDGFVGPVRDVVTSPEYFDVMVPPGSAFVRSTPRDNAVFAYVYAGSGEFEGSGGERARDRDLVVFERGDAVSVRAGAESLRFLLVTGRPIGEPIAWRGPIVMNTEDELRVAFDELERGTFAKARAGRR